MHDQIMIDNNINISNLQVYCKTSNKTSQHQDSATKASIYPYSTFK